MGRGAEQIKWPIHLEVNLYPRAFCLCFLLFGHGIILALLFTLNFSLFFLNCCNFCWLDDEHIYMVG